MHHPLSPQTRTRTQTRTATHRLSTLLILLTLTLTSCTIPTGFGETVTQPFNENGVTGELIVNSFKQLEIGASGSGHYVVVPTFRKERGYKVSIQLEGRDRMYVRVQFTGREAPEKEALMEILEKNHLAVSTESDCMAWWQDGEDGFLGVYHFTETGQPFSNHQYAETYPVATGEMPIWEDLLSAWELAYLKILDTAEVYNTQSEGKFAGKNYEFWDMLNEVDDNEQLDQTILQIWGQSFNAEQWVEKRCRNGAHFSESWKKEAMAKAWKISHREIAQELIYAIGTTEEISRLDGQLISKWPEEFKDLEKRLGMDEPPFSDERKEELVQKCTKVASQTRPGSGDDKRELEKKAQNLQSAAWMAKELKQEETFQLVGTQMVGFWPGARSAQEYILGNYAELTAETQARYLELAEKEIRSETDLSFRAIELLEEFAPCEQLVTIHADYPESVNDSLRRCVSK